MVLTRQSNISGHDMLHAFGQPVYKCWEMVDVVGSSLKLIKFEPTTFNMSQHFAPGWPNACNMLCPTILMLRYVALSVLPFISPTILQSIVVPGV